MAQALSTKIQPNRKIDVPDFPDWLKRVTPNWTWDWTYQRYIQAQLDRLTRGEINKLMINCPPRHGKSEKVTIRYPIWRLQRDPTMRVVIGAYNQVLADKFSRKARRIAEGVIELSKERTAVSDWETARGGGMRAVGVGGGITGQGGNLIIIDDPVKNREEANSETYRERCWDWYTDDLYTRLEPGGQLVVIQTRWHEDDLAGRILASDDAPNWTVINLPALALDGDELGRAPGEALCPERYDVEALEGIRSVLGSYSFQALYQGSPTPEEGARFRRSWFREFEQIGDLYALHQPDGGVRYVKVSDCYTFQTVDPAATESAQSDYFVCSTWAVTPMRDLLLLDVFRERAETTKHEQILKPLIERWKPRFIGVENVSYGLNIIQRLLVLGYPVIKLQADRDKVSRSLLIQARYEAGAVYHRKGASWLMDVEDELMHFPLGKHDDFVDTASYAGIHLANYGEYVPTIADTPPPDTRKKGSIAARFEAEIEPETEEYY